MVARQRQSSAVAAGLTAFGNIDFGSNNKTKSTPVPQLKNTSTDATNSTNYYSRFSDEGGN